MKILVLAGEIPATTNMPGSPRLFSLCRHLSDTHELTLTTRSPDPERHRTFLEDPISEGVFDEIVVLPEAPRPSWWNQQRHRLARETHWCTRLRNPEYHAKIEERIRGMLVESGFDLLYVDGLSGAQYVVDNDLPCPAIIDAHDSLTLLYRRHAKVETGWLQKLRLRSEARSLARWERSLGSAFELVVLNSPVDEEAWRELDPEAPTATIGNGVDSDFFQPSDPVGAGEEPGQLLFTGVMDYGPNEDAAVYFTRQVLPRVRERRPEVRFSVVGKSPSPAVQALNDHPAVTVTGGVPDMRPYLEKASVFVCPLRWGAGVKNKLLVALAMEKAVVCTARSTDGLEVRDGVELQIADDPDDFAAEVLRLLDDRELARRLGAAGRELVTARYSWRSRARAFEALLTSIVEGKARARTAPSREGPA